MKECIGKKIADLKKTHYGAYKILFEDGTLLLIVCDTTYEDGNIETTMKPALAEGEDAKMLGGDMSWANSIYS